MNYGRAPIKMEGGIADPDEMDWACNCDKCKAKYQKWKRAFDEQQAQLYGESNEATDNTKENQGR